ncbi:carbon-nitrogen hydrolase [Bryobacterales bacterium F-183]|nr:carbon-nitrogen hydrolase [Bryobacterales bacterium F-183]
MWIAAVQFQAAKGNWKESSERLERLIETGCPPKTALIVCPEMALTGYVFPSADAARAVAEVAGEGPTFELASRIAQRHDAYFVAGYPELGEGGKLYNSAMIVSPAGQLLYNYRKRFLYEMDESWAQPGDCDYPFIDTPFGPLTCGICMDLNDRRFIEFLFAAGPTLIAFPTNWLDQGFDVRGYWRRRLHGYQGWLVAANTYGVEEGTPFRGRSSILTPDGGLAADAPPEGDAVVLASLTT